MGATFSLNLEPNRRGRLMVVRVVVGLVVVCAGCVLVVMTGGGAVSGYTYMPPNSCCCPFVWAGGVPGLYL